MVAIRVSVDRKAALLRGLDLRDQVTVEVAAETFGDSWKPLVELLDMSGPVPVLSGAIRIEEPTAEAVKVALAMHLERRGEAAREALDKLREAVDARRRTVAEEPVETMLYGEGPHAPIGSRYKGFQRPLHYIETTHRYTGLTLNQEQQKEWEKLAEEAKDLEKANNAQIREMNRVALEAALPDLIAAHEERMAEIAREAEAREAKEREECAKRVSTGYWEIETDSYNSRRYGAPWCAQVTGLSGSDLVYSWGDSTAKHGSEGLLRVRCKPGEIVAWGQKDLRGKNSEHHILRMREDGSMEPISKTTAYRHFAAG